MAAERDGETVRWRPRTTIRVALACTGFREGPDATAETEALYHDEIKELSRHEWF